MIHDDLYNALRSETPQSDSRYPPRNRDCGDFFTRLPPGNAGAGLE